MASWVHVFSKFTYEALLFEALFICLLCAGYAAFWVLRKRRYGVLGKEHPNYAVKSYLSQLILDAEEMRIQLFGILAGTGVDPHLMAQLRSGQPGFAGMMSAASGASLAISNAALAADPALAAKLSAIEAKMSEQARAMETIVTEKTRIEKELTELRSGKGRAPAVTNVPDPALLEKLKALEAKLAEYSVIEDDLANLKRLQQENAALKAQLGGKAPATAAAAPAVAAVAVATTPVAPAPVAEAVETPATAAVEETAAAAEAVAATDASLAEVAAAPAALESTPPEPIAAPTADAGFEGLVDHVEQTLVEPAAGAAAVDPVAAAPATGTPALAEKTDADLVAEFEKMLNS